MLRDEFVDRQAGRAGRAVLVVALEVDHFLVGYDLARLLQQESVHSEAFAGPCIEDDAVAVQAVLVGQSATAFDPGFGPVLRGQRPAQESLDLVLVVDDEAKMLAVDLADQYARPLAEAQAGK